MTEQTRRWCRIERGGTRRPLRPTMPYSLAWRVELFRAGRKTIDADGFCGERHDADGAALVCGNTARTFGPNIYLELVCRGRRSGRSHRGGHAVLCPEDQNITDVPGRSLTDTAPTSGTNDNSYAVDNTAPVLASIERQSPMTERTNADALTWRVTYSEPVTGVDTDDFALTTGTTATVTAVAEVAPGTSAGSAVWDVTASGGDLATGSGTIILRPASTGAVHFGCGRQRVWTRGPPRRAPLKTATRWTIPRPRSPRSCGWTRTRQRWWPRHRPSPGG